MSLGSTKPHGRAQVTFAEVCLPFLVTGLADENPKGVEDLSNLRNAEHKILSKAMRCMTRASRGWEERSSTLGPRG